MTTQETNAVKVEATELDAPAPSAATSIAAAYLAKIAPPLTPEPPTPVPLTPESGAADPTAEEPERREGQSSEALYHEWNMGELQTTPWGTTKRFTQQRLKAVIPQGGTHHNHINLDTEAWTALAKELKRVIDTARWWKLEKAQAPRYIELASLYSAMSQCLVGLTQVLKGIENAHNGVAIHLWDCNRPDPITKLGTAQQVPKMESRRWIESGDKMLLALKCEKVARDFYAAIPTICEYASRHPPYSADTIYAGRGSEHEELTKFAKKLTETLKNPSAAHWQRVYDRPGYTSPLDA